MKTKKAKKAFLDGYKTYSPEKEGYGSPSDWVENFRSRMGLNEAKEVLGDNDPFNILGLPKGASWGEIKSAYRKLAMQTHPDRNPGDEEAAIKFKKVQAAYEILEARYKE